MRPTISHARRKHIPALLGFALASTTTALSGARSTRQGLGPWYARLHKPPFQPPSSAFAPVWTVLYGLMTLSAWRVYRQPPSVQRRRALALWGAQLGLNGLWSWLFFAKRQPRAALLDCALLLATTATYSWVARAVDRRAARLFVPYVGWTAFATLLNAEIVRRNPAPTRG